MLLEVVVMVAVMNNSLCLKNWKESLETIIGCTDE